MWGPSPEAPYSNLHVSPIGVVPKASGGWRMITHLSYPPSESVNNYIDHELATVKYTSFDTVIDTISKLGTGAKLGKMDVQSAFRLIPIHPDDFSLLGFHFRGSYYIDKCLPFGCSISCSIFEKFATFLEWLVKFESGVPTVHHYLDDFVFAASSESNECSQLMHTFKRVCGSLGIPLNEEKTEGPSTQIIYLGLLIDTIQQKISIPENKLKDLASALLTTIGKKKVTLKELQSLVGKLNFFSKAIKGSRAFNRRFYNAMSGTTSPFHRIRVSKPMRDDLHTWLTFLYQFNGSTYFSESEWTNANTLDLYTDSAGSASLGCGAILGSKWAFLPWPAHWGETEIIRDVTFLELIPIVLALSLWGNLLQNKKIVMHIDNQALVMGQVPVSGSSRRTRTNQSSSELPEQPIVGEISRLIQNSVSKNTQNLYASGIDAFDSFRRSQNLPVIWPPPTNHIVQFIAAMSLKGYAESTVRSYIKGVSFKCKIYHQCDPTRYFVISKMLEGMKCLTKTPDTRLPITISMLSLMLPKLDIICTNLYEAKLFRAAFSISFFAFLRIGELALSKGNSAESVIGIRDIKLSNSELSLLIRKSKTDQYGKGIHILLHRTGDSNCPVEKMAQFLRIRPVIDGPLFCHFDRSPITRYQFSSVLSKTIRSLGLNSLNFKTHSFRIGAATTAAEMGLSDSDIQVAGRWRSQAFKAYIRSPLTPI
ncbi:hypothetical protein FSP39_000036 [Pinctada imbricata]|uniref:Reverse transcriptase domain-containing protein n=1 Tax=Pinctada imbricata TaxID=66713 RepID=A0AA89BY37_PINIB|nr:hypothetical protein FSP39_000036 [Pinctada imbricata]